MLNLPCDSCVADHFPNTDVNFKYPSLKSNWSMITSINEIGFHEPSGLIRDARWISWSVQRVSCIIPWILLLHSVFVTGRLVCDCRVYDCNMFFFCETVCVAGALRCKAFCSESLVAARTTLFSICVDPPHDFCTLDWLQGSTKIYVVQCNRKFRLEWQYQAPLIRRTSLLSAFLVSE